MEKNQKLIVLASLTLVFTATASALTLENPDTSYSDNETLYVEILDAGDKQDLEVNVSKNGAVIHEDIQLTEDNGNYINNNVDISGANTGDEINVSVNETDAGYEYSSFIVDKEVPVVDKFYPDSSNYINGNFKPNLTVSNYNSKEADVSVNLSVFDSSDNKVYHEETPVSSKDTSLSQITVGSGNDIDNVGSYEFQFNVTDNAGNQKIETSDVMIDYKMPSLDISYKGYNGNDDYFGPTMEVESSANSMESGVEYFNYTINNGDASNSFSDIQDELDIDLDSIVDSGNQFDIEFEIRDKAGNKDEITNTSLGTDFEDPEINLSSPGSSRINTSDTFLLNGTFEDFGDSKLNLSATKFEIGSQDSFSMTDSNSLEDSDELDKDSGFSIPQGVSDDSEGYLRGLYNVSDFDEGVYDAELKVVDNASNSVSKGFEVGVSSEGPVPEGVSVNGSELESGDYIGSEGVVDFDVDWSGVAPENFSYNWEGDGNDGFETVNESSFSYDLGENNYTLEIEATDYLGNTGSVNFSNVTVDNTVPSLGVERLTSRGWSSSHRVEVSCTREGSPVSEIGIRHSNGTMVKGWDTETGENYTFSEHGENTYEAVCKDEVGLENTEEFTLKIDKKKPEIAKTTPEESATGVNITETLKLDLNTNTTLSGVNSSLTKLNLSKGNITSTTITNQKVEAETELPFEEYITFSGTIYDQLNNTKEFQTGFTTRDEPEDWTKIAETTNTSREMVLGVTNLDISKDTGRLNLELRNTQSIKKVELQRNQSGEASMMVVEDQNMPSTINEREGETYIYAAVEPRDISNDNITSANLTFQLDEEWVNNLELEDPEFVVERFNSDTEEWEKLPTKVQNQSEGVELTAETKHFSWFAPGTTQQPKGILDLIKEQISKAREADLQNYITIFLVTFIVAIVLYLLYALGYIKLDIINVKIPKINH